MSFLDRFQREALDRHITGNYSADQFAENDFGSSIVEDAFIGQGMTDRREGKALSDCPYKSPRAIKAWRFGWVDEDALINEEEYHG